MRAKDEESVRLNEEEEAKILAAKKNPKLSPLTLNLLNIFPPQYLPPERGGGGEDIGREEEVCILTFTITLPLHRHRHRSPLTTYLSPSPSPLTRLADAEASRASSPASAGAGAPRPKKTLKELEEANAYATEGSNPGLAYPRIELPQTSRPATTHACEPYLGQAGLQHAAADRLAVRGGDRHAVTRSGAMTRWRGGGFVWKLSIIVREVSRACLPPGVLADARRAATFEPAAAAGWVTCHRGA
eukprot:scaffold28702_cov62-Phaeocystis_antarctica.AAC.2